MGSSDWDWQHPGIGKGRKGPGAATAAPPAALLRLQGLAGNKATSSLIAGKGRGRLQDAQLEALVSSCPNQEVQEIAARVAEMEARAKSGTMKHDITEEIGKERDELVAEIREIRDRVEKLSDTGVDPKKLVALQVGFYHAINKASPSYWQSKNIDILEPPEATKTRTCNITSLSMALEALGRTAADYNGGDFRLITKVAKVYAPQVSAARDTVGKGLVGLRLPDFIELAAIAEKLSGKEPTEDAIRAAMIEAWKSITSIYFLQKLAARFRVKGKVRFLSLSGEASSKETKDSDRLGDFGSKNRKATEKYVDARLEKESLALELASMSAGKARDKALKHYEQLEKEVSKSVAGGADIEKKLPLEEYKRAILMELGQELDAGHEIVASITRHYVRLESVGEDFVTVDDPGRANRANRQVKWEEARAMGYLKYWLSLSP